MMKTQKIIPNLWFDPQKFPAEQAAEFYTRVFKNAVVENTALFGKSGQELHQQQPGSVMTVKFTIENYAFVGLNGGSHFQFNPSISFFVVGASGAEIDDLWQKLKESGQVLMPLDTYDWSPKYAWIQDQFGVNWQLMLDPSHTAEQKIVPSFFFTGKSQGKAEEAIQFYTSIFKDSEIERIQKYTEADNNPYALGTVKHAQFQLEGQTFVAMDSGMENDFPFSEAISLIIACKTQEEIDYYWNALSAVPEAEQCGWLKDKFGISWQVVPSTLLDEMMQDPDTQKRERVIAAFMQMKKFNIQQLKAAFEGTFITDITSKTSL